MAVSLFRLLTQLCFLTLCLKVTQLSAVELCNAPVISNNIADHLQLMFEEVPFEDPDDVRGEEKICCSKTQKRSSSLVVNTVQFHSPGMKEYSAVAGAGNEVGTNFDPRLFNGDSWLSPVCHCLKCEGLRAHLQLQNLTRKSRASTPPVILVLDLDNFGYRQFQLCPPRLDKKCQISNVELLSTVYVWAFFGSCFTRYHKVWPTDELLSNLDDEFSKEDIQGSQMKQDSIWKSLSSGKRLQLTPCSGSNQGADSVVREVVQAFSSTYDIVVVTGDVELIRLLRDERRMERKRSFCQTSGDSSTPFQLLFVNVSSLGKKLVPVWQAIASQVAGLRQPKVVSSTLFDARHAGLLNMAARPPLAQKAAQNHLANYDNNFRCEDHAVDVVPSRNRGNSAILMNAAEEPRGYSESLPRAYATQAHQSYQAIQDLLREKLALLEGHGGLGLGEEEGNAKHTLKHEEGGNSAEDDGSVEEPSAILFASEMGPRDHSFSMQEELQHQSHELQHRSFTPSPSPRVKLPTTVRSGRSVSNGISSSRSRTQVAHRTTGNQSCEDYELKPMNRSTKYIEELTGAELLAVLRMRHVIQSFGHTEEYKLPPTQCHRMLLTEEEQQQSNHGAEEGVLELERYTTLDPNKSAVLQDHVKRTSGQTRGAVPKNKKIFYACQVDPFWHAQFRFSVLTSEMKHFPLSSLFVWGTSVGVSRRYCASALRSSSLVLAPATSSSGTKVLKAKGITKASPTTRRVKDEQDRLSQIVLEGASVFVGGKAGTGKSFFLRRVIEELREKGLKVAVAGSTGIAALNVGGNTFHSVFGAPVDSVEEPLSLRRWEYVIRRDVIAQHDVIVVDEVSFLHGGYLELLERCARTAPGKNAKKPFGGTQVIISGDFLQLNQSCTSEEETIQCPGVDKSLSFQEMKSKFYKKGARKEWVFYRNTPMFESYAFQNFLLQVELLCSHRHQDPKFVEALNRLRIGELPKMLAQSASINKENPLAVRLFATKNFVRQHNDSKMMSLRGEDHWFPSEIMVSGVPNHMLDSHQFMSDVLTLFLIHPSCDRKSRITSSEAQKVVAELVASCGIPLGNTIWCVLAHGGYHSTSSQVAIRFSGATAKRCETHLSSAMKWAMNKVKSDEAKIYRATQVAKPGRKNESDRSSRWMILRFNRKTIEQLSTLVKHTIDKSLLSSIRNDYALCGKTLKQGCRVMLLKNINQVYVNGSLGTIVDFIPVKNVKDLLPKNMRTSPFINRGSRIRVKVKPEKTYLSSVSPFAAVSSGVPQADGNKSTMLTPLDVSGSVDGMIPLVQMDVDKEIIAVPYLRLPVQSESVQGFYQCQVICMPLTPAYAFTVHKVQGLTFNFPVVFDAKGLFPCDHIVYVAASRVTQFKHLRILNLSPKMISVNRRCLQFALSLPNIDESERTWKKEQFSGLILSDDDSFRCECLIALASVFFSVLYPLFHLFFTPLLHLLFFALLA
eukprot:gene13273-9115_t